MLSHAVAQRVSHSLLDPFVAPHLPRLYRALHLPRWLPPEGIIAIGHLLAIGAALAFALTTRWWWSGVLAAFGVAGNHLADLLDGTHARATGQCRNGGELLDHFTDPLSFSYWMIGIGLSVALAPSPGADAAAAFLPSETARIWIGLCLALVSVIIIYAMSVLTNIRAKLTGVFRLHSFGPTEFKSLLTLYGLAMAGLGLLAPRATPPVALAWLILLTAIGVITLAVTLVAAVREVNRDGTPPDASEWNITGSESAPRGTDVDP